MYEKVCFKISRFVRLRLKTYFIQYFSLGNTFLLPISISLVCYIRIYIGLIYMQRHFSRAFKRYLHIPKNLIIQILVLFLNFAVFWLPAEIIMLYAKDHYLKDAIQVTKSFNILFDPLIITGFDTRYSSAAQDLLSRWPFYQLVRFLITQREHNSLASTSAIRDRLRRPYQLTNQHTRKDATGNIANNDDITIFETLSSYFDQRRRIRRQQQSSSSSPLNLRESINKQKRARQNRMNI